MEGRSWLASVASVQTGKRSRDQWTELEPVRKCKRCKECSEKVDCLEGSAVLFHEVGNRRGKVERAKVAWLQG